MTVWQDLRSAARILRKHPGFTLGAALTLSLGITGTVTVLAVTKTLVVAPQAVRDSGRVVRLFLVDPEGNDRKFSSLDYNELQAQPGVFAGIAAYSAANVELRDGSAPSDMASAADTRRAVALRVSANYFSTLGVQMRLGRSLQPQDDRPDSVAVAVISDALWQRHYGRDSGVLGRRIGVNGNDFTVIGVAPPQFHGLDPAGPDLWVPHALPLGTDPGPGTSEQFRWLYLIGRLAFGVTTNQAQAAMAIVAGRWGTERPERANARILVTTASVINAESRGRILPLMGLVFAAVGFVLLIACANVANLLLARGVSRQREISTRLALGATRWHVIRQLLAESVLLSLLGALGSALLAQWITPMLSLAVTRTAGRSPADLNVQVDGWVLAATVVISFFTAVLFGLAPALQITRPNLVSALKLDGSAVHPRVTASRARSVLVAAQVALSLVLLTGAGLFTRALLRSQSFDLGFNAENLLIVTPELRRHAYDEAAARAFYEHVTARISSLPGVRSVSLARVVPASDLYLGEVISIEGRGPTIGPASRLVTYYDVVSPNYFASLQIPIVRGRVFSLAQRETDVVVVNEAFVDRFLRGAENPFGTRIRLGGAETPWLEIVGVVKDTMHGRPGEHALPLVYRPLYDASQLDLSLLVRTNGDTNAIRAVLATDIRALDQHLSPSIRTMQENIHSAMWPAKVGALLGTVVGSLALVLAAVGLFGVMAYTVNQRAREVGIRMALGASGNDVMRWVLWQSFGMVGMGILFGLIVAATLSRALSAFLFGLSPWDPAAFLGCAMLLSGTALVATYIPARRAMRVDLTTALRQE
jgi:predicted permease